MLRLVHRLVLAVMLIFGASNVVYAESLDDALAAARRGDYVKAMEIMRPLADKGVVPAQGYIGILYRDGLGVQQNDQEAVTWFRKAAEGGDMLSRTNLAVMYLNGRGIDQNYEEALKWLQLAAEQGDSLAYQILGEMYAIGLGVQADGVQALYWFELAVLKRRTEAAKARDNLKAQLSATEQATVHEAVRKCRSLGYIGCGPLPSEPLLRLPAAVLAQELVAYKTTAANIKMQIEAGATASFVNVAGKDWKVTKENLDAFLKEMQSSIDEFHRAAEQRGYPQIAGRYSLVAGGKCTGDDFDVSGIFATVDTNGQRVLLNELTVRQAGYDIEIMISGQNEAGQPQEYALPAVLVENALIVGNLGNEPFNLWGTLEGRRIEFRFDEQQLKTAYGSDSGSEADWAQVRDCFVSMTPAAP